MSWQRRIDSALEQRRATDSFRVRLANQQGSARYLVQDGTRYLNFSSNDYLGVSQHAEVITAWQQGAEIYGVGSGGSGHVTGYNEAHQQFEQQLAAWLGFPRALLFISGFAANQAVIAALAEKTDSIIADKLSHASLLEAAMHSPAQLRRFAHNDVASLQTLLAQQTDGEQLVITEGVFSMDGDAAPLAEIAQATRYVGGLLMVDDAHGIGVIGSEGRGSCYQQQVQPDILVVTFGKAFGVSGAAVLCSEPMANYLLQFARHLIYSTAMPPAQAYALSAALDVVRRNESRRVQLQANIARFRKGAEQLPLKLMASQTAIQPLIVGENQIAVNLAATLREQGFWLTAIRPPTVPAGTARLRVTLTASHTSDDIDSLLEALYDATR
ncbi:8-amino-7-oxononanoate synthase [Buttiauxella sp. B2]|uniref:8-amino-7-oxononanoate synthase n=1 Tax=Buttiauxella sp. B2 TaxID=2587812 RepID=UPI00111FCB0B|nr:8-amino-7-oxononanoate synthase [Buttiauxella sp. B2]TNV21513.1 8-amino-7-oxononanoate synthase [Buttiauxella sp. B2]